MPAHVIPAGAGGKPFRSPRPDRGRVDLPCGHRGAHAGHGLCPACYQRWRLVQKGQIKHSRLPVPVPVFGYRVAGPSRKEQRLARQLAGPRCFRVRVRLATGALFAPVIVSRTAAEAELKARTLAAEIGHGRDPWDATPAIAVGRAQRICLPTTHVGRHDGMGPGLTRWHVEQGHRVSERKAA